MSRESSVIIGAGPAGLTAAYELGKRGLTLVVFATVKIEGRGEEIESLLLLSEAEEWRDRLIWTLTTEPPATLQRNPGRGKSHRLR